MKIADIIRAGIVADKTKGMILSEAEGIAHMKVQQG